MMRRSFLFPVRFVAFFTAAVFTWTQTVFAVGEGPYEQYQARPVQSSVEVSGGEEKISRPERTPGTSLDFLSGKNSPLSLSEKPSQNIPVDSQKKYSADESSFEDAVAQFSPDYASAVVVKSLSAENLRELNRLDVEVGIAVIRGKIVMFTTGSREGLRVNPVVQSILSESSIIVHTHPQGAQATPSMFDVYLAGETTEYLLSSGGVQAYNSKGIVASDLPEDDLIALLETNHAPEASSVEARNVLNSFIAEIDKYNSDPAQYSVYRSSSSLTWIPAPSNPGYVVTAVYWNNLWVAGIKRSGASDATASIFATSESCNFQSVFDVSPDGSTIFYGIGDTIYVQRVNDSSQKISAPGRYTSISFKDLWAKISWVTNGFSNTVWLNVQTAEIRTSDPITPPSGFVKINNDSTYTTSQNVTINLSVSSSASRLAQMRFSLDGGANWTGWETYSAVKTLALPSRDGTKEIQCQVSDTAGDISAFSDTIILDTIAPAVVVNSGTPTLINVKTLTVNYTVDGVTKSKTFANLIEGRNTLTITETDAAGNQAIKTWNVTADTTAPAVVVNTGTPALINVKTLTINYTVDGATRAKTFTNLIEGGNTLTITETDAAGNQSVKMWDVTVDTIAPVLGIDPAIPGLINTKTFTIHYTADDISRSKVFDGLSEGENVLSITETDLAGNSAVKTFKMTIDTTPPVVVITSKTTLTRDPGYSLFYKVDGNDRVVFRPLAEGLNTLTVTSNDLAGNIAAASINVTLDITAPTGSVKINHDAVYTTKQNVTLDLSGTDAGSGVNRVSFSTDNVNWSAAEAYTAIKSRTLSAEDGVKTIYVKYFDKAGNASRVYSASIVLDSAAPVGSMSVNHDAVSTNNRDVTLTLSAMDTISGAGQMRFSMDEGLHWTAWKNYAATKSLTVSAGDGEKTIYFQVQDKAGNFSEIYSKEIILDTTGPVVVVNSETPALLNTKTLTINYTADGIAKSKLFTDLIEGINTLTLEENDAAGNQSVKTWDVTVDTVPPVILCNSPSTTMDPDYTLAYTVDGVTHSEIRRSLSPWKNELNVSATDAAGNVAQTIYTVNYLPASLPDGTRFIYEDNKLRQEITPDGKTIFYDREGRVTQFVFTDGRKIVYGADEPHSIFIYGSDQSLVKQIDKTISSPDQTKWIELTLQEGIKAYYLNGKLKEIKTATGIRMVDILFDDGQNIKDAALIYPDGTQEFIWEGSLLRRVGPDGSVLDFLPTEWIAREIVGKVPQYYVFEKLSQTETAQTKVFTGTAFSVYDEAGILQEVQDGNDGHFIFTRSTETGEFHTQLDRGRSSTPKDKTMVEARYTREGQLTWLKLQDGTEVFFTDGQISRAVDASGAEIDYSLLQDEGFLEGLKATRSGTQFIYDKNGFLKQIVTEEGTVTRVQEDTDNDGSITDKDIVRLFLDTVSGYKLTDFELDSQGNILKGLLETQAGIRQFIENGSVVRFETVDGRIYDYKNGEAELKEWRFQDGKRILYGGGNITEILFADGTRLHTLGFDADRQIKTYTEESGDGTEKLFQDGKLVQTTLPDHRVIHYGADGYAEKVTLADGTEQTISYKRDPEGQITGLILEGAQGRREFTSEGELLRLFQNGVSAEITDGVISKLSTRFGEMENPQFSAAETPDNQSQAGNSGGMLSGTVNLVDGTQLVLENGELKKAVHSDKTEITYVDGRAASVKTDQGIYELSYTQQAAQPESGNILSDVLVHFEPVQEKTINSVSLTCTAQGETKLTSTSRLGSNAAIFDGNGDSLIVSPGEAFDLGIGDFTIEAWVNFSAVNRPYAIASKYVNDGQGWIFYINTATAGQSMSLYDSAQHAVTIRNVVFLPNQWYHVAVVRSGDKIKFFKDGVQQGTDQTAAADYNGDAVPLKIGEYGAKRGSFYGSMDELRISNVARWTASFTPPASEYEVDEYTQLLHHFETLGKARQFSSVTIHPNGDYSLVPFLLEHPDEKFSQALFSRPLYDTLKNQTNLVTELDTGGEDSENPVFFAQLIEDAGRDTVYEFSGDYLPEWLNVSLDPANRNSGFISRSVTMGYGGTDDHLPATTADLIDLTGDGLPDRVFMETGLKADYWWVQVNSGSGFLAPVKWQGVSRSYDPAAWASMAYNLGSLRFYEGRHPHVLGELIDINGDKRPDRVVVKDNGSNGWYVQLNNGQGFDPVTLWAENVQPVSQWSFQATYALEVRDDASNKNVQELIADMIDMDGDGLLDRVIRPYVEPLDRWFVQKNLGTGFADAVLWEGVDTGFPAPNKKTSSSLSWYQNDRGFVRDHADLVDINGDGRADRVLLKPKDPANPNSAQDWYVQFNNGKGFDPPVLWDADVRRLTGLATDEIGTSLRVFENWNNPRNLLVDLVDVTGDGLPDRVSVAHWGDKTYSSWFVEVNDGKTFLPAVEWTGIVGTNAMQTAIGQDNENFRSNPDGGTTSLSGRSPDFVKQVAKLKDINGDKIPDRIIYEQTETRWFVQFGTGSGFLPVQEMTLDGLETSLETSTTSVHSSRYDYLHVSLRSENGVPAEEGSVKVTLGTPEDPGSYQEWTVTDLTTDWQDFYLPVDRTKADAPEVKIVFLPDDPSASSTPPSIYVDNMTFTSLRPPAGKDWLDHLLTGENILANVQKAASEDITQYLETGTSDPGTQMDWQELLQAETRITFDDKGDVREFETLYGSVSKIESGQVTETKLPDGTTVQFSTAETGSSTTTQEITNPDGTTQSQTLAYGRVRQVTASTGQTLQYSYEFTSDGKEITVVLDPESGIIEKYQDVTVNGRLVTQLVSRTQATGVETRFEYDTSGNLARSSLWYKGRERESFEHSIAANGNQVITTGAGVREEYDKNGKILRHVTADGYCYTHSFERAKKVVMEMKTITEYFADGTSLNVEVPYLTWVDDPEGEIIHRVTLTGYTDVSGNVVEYGADNANSLASVMKSLRLTDGTRLTFDRLGTEEITDPEADEVKTEIRLLDVTIFHADGTITEFRNGKPCSVTSAAGRVISLVTEKGPNGEELLIDPDGSAQFHLAQAKQIWETLVLSKWETYKLAGTLPVRTEYVSTGNNAGKMVTREFAEGTVELYNDAGQVEELLSPEGERMVSYQYDSDGNLIRIQMEGSRRRLESAVLRIKADVAVEREKAMAAIADREQVLNQTIEGEYVVQRDRLLEIRAQIEAQRDKLKSLDVEGDEAQGLVADAMKKIQGGLDQVNAALAELAKKRQEALADLNTKVKEAYTGVETQTRDSYKDLEEKSAQIRHSILEQEILPVVFHWYRKILGRDPNKSEYDAVVAKADYAAGTFDLEGLKNSLRNGQEFLDRTAQVNAIKAKVGSELDRYLLLSDADKAAYAARLGIASSELVAITEADVTAMKAWLAKQPLHFGQSAFIALEALLKDAGIVISREELAVALILTDILTGTLTSLDQSDLLISFYAMKRLAAKYELDLSPMAMTYDVLRAMYVEACGQSSEACSLRLVARIDGNHFIIITKVTDKEVSYIDPGAGPENALETVTISKEDFLKVWVDPGAGNVGSPNDGRGYVLSPRPPPLIMPSAEVTEDNMLGGGIYRTMVPFRFFGPNDYQILSTSQQMSVRGAFLPFLIFIVAAIIQAIVATVTAIIAAISAIIGGIISGVSAIASGFGAFFTGLFTGNFIAGIQGVLSGVVAGLGQVVGGVFGGIIQLGQGLIGALTGLHTSLVGGISQGLGTGFFSSIFGGAFQSGFLAGFINVSLIGFELQGIMTLMDVIGIAPVLQGSFMSGLNTAMGIGLLATGNPLGIGFVAGGATGFLNQFTDLSPELTGIINIGATALGVFAGGVIAPGISGLQALQSTLPYLSAGLAGIGVAAVGDLIGLDPRLANLLSIPVSAAVGGLVGGYLDPNSGGGSGKGVVLGYRDDGTAISVTGPKGLMDYVTESVLSPASMSGIVSVGAQIGLDAIGAPTVLQNFLPDLLGQIAVGAGIGLDIESTGEGIFDKIWDNIKEFGSGLVSAGANLISFGSKVLEGAVDLTKAGFAKAVDFFSGMFDRPTRESLVHAGNGSIENYIETNAILNGKTATVTFGNGEIVWNQTTDTLSVIDATGTRTYSNISMNDSGKFFGGITITEQMGDDVVLKQNYTNGRLDHIDGVSSLTDDPLFSISDPLGNGISLTSTGILSSGVFQNFTEGVAYAFEDGSLSSLSVLRNGLTGAVDNINADEKFSFQVVTDPLTPQTKIVYDIGQDVLNSFIDAGKLPPLSQWGADTGERLGNYLMGFDFRTNEEIVQDHALKMEAAFTIAQDGDLIFGNGDTLVDCGVKAGDRSFSLGENRGFGTFVNHVGIIQTDFATDEKYVVETNPGGFRRTKLEDFIARYRDFEINRPKPELEASKAVNYLFDNYIDPTTNGAKIGAPAYDYLGLLGLGFNSDQATSSNPTTLYCSSAVYNAFFNTFGKRSDQATAVLPGVVEDFRISPQDIWQERDEWDESLVEIYQRDEGQGG